MYIRLYTNWDHKKHERKLLEYSNGRIIVDQAVYRTVLSYRHMVKSSITNCDWKGC